MAGMRGDRMWGEMSSPRVGALDFSPLPSCHLVIRPIQPPTRSGWSAGWPMRNIHWLPRTERTLRRTWLASV